MPIPAQDGTKAVPLRIVELRRRDRRRRPDQHRRRGWHDREPHVTARRPRVASAQSAAARCCAGRRSRARGGEVGRACAGGSPGTRPRRPRRGRARDERWCARARWPPAFCSGSCTRTRYAPTGPRRCSKTAWRSIASPAGSATPTCGPPAATPPTTPITSTTSQTSLTVAIRRHDERGAERERPRLPAVRHAGRPRFSRPRPHLRDTSSAGLAGH